MEAIRRFLEETLEKEKIAGMAVAITDREKVIFAEGFGVESIERPQVGASAVPYCRISRGVHPGGAPAARLPMPPVYIYTRLPAWGS